MKSIELFAGAGGLLLGASLAGFEHVVAAEWNHACCETLRANQRNGHPLTRDDMEIIEGDVRDVDWSKWRDDVDLLAGGPPCQPFSLGGLAKAYDDERDMFPAYAKALDEIRPKAFICENVNGLARSAFREYLEYILNSLERPSVRKLDGETWTEHRRRLASDHEDGETTYEVKAKVIDAADYGVAQRRKRLIIVGFRTDLGVRWEFPEPTHSAKGGDGKLPWRTVTDGLHGLPDPRSSFENVMNHEYRSGAKSYKGHSGSALDAPSKTIKAGVHGVPGGENMIAFPDGTARYYTVREAARIQGFPDDYEFFGSWSDGMKQIGNAVPVELARVMTSSIALALLESEARKEAEYSKLEESYEREEDRYAAS